MALSAREILVIGGEGPPGPRRFERLAVASVERGRLEGHEVIWSEESPLPWPLVGFEALREDDGTVTVIGGSEGGRAPARADVLNWDGARWRRRPSLRRARESFTLVTAPTHSLVLVCGGYDTSDVRILSCERRDPVSLEWEHVVYDLRCSGGGTVGADGRVYLEGCHAGGAQSGSNLPESSVGAFLVLDPSNAWSVRSIAVPGAGLSGVAMVAAGERVLGIAGGTDALRGSPRVVRLDGPEAEVLEPLAKGRELAAVVDLPGGAALVAGNDAAIDWVPARGTIRTTVRLGTPREGHTATRLGEYVLVVGGVASMLGKPIESAELVPITAIRGECESRPAASTQ